MKTLLRLLLATLLLAAGRPAPAQVLDPALLPTTLRTTGSSYGVRALLRQPDGKLLVAGDFDLLGGALSNNVVRLDASGSRDLSFHPSPGANGPVRALALQPDGKLLVGGDFTGYDGTATGPLVRLLPDGSLDATFQPALPAYPAQVRALVLLPSGAILVGGRSGAGLPGGLLRLLPTGATDAAFSVGTGAQYVPSSQYDTTTPVVNALAVQPTDGRILVGGDFTTFSGGSNKYLTRLLPGGAIDTGFTPTDNIGGSYRTVYDLDLQPDGKILAAGAFSYASRLFPSGLVDNTFLAPFSDRLRVRFIRAETGGNVLVAGDIIGNSVQAVMRLLPSGTPDASFVAPLTSGQASVVLPLPGGQYLAGGNFAPAGGPAALCRLSASGSLDASLNLGLEARGTVSQCVPLATGQLLVQGTFTSFNGQPVSASAHLHRLQADGSYDQGLSLPLPALANTVGYSGLWPQPDGQVYGLSYTARPSCTSRTCGGSTPYTIYTYTLTRVLASNALDVSFSPATFNYFPFLRQVLPLPGGGVLLVGTFYVGTTGSAWQPQLRRLLPSGAADASFAFAPALLGGGDFDRVVVAPGGQLLVSYHDATGASNLLRLSANGSLDATYSVGASPAQPAGATFAGQLLQPDGKLLVAGTFTSFGGQAAPAGLVRLLPTGAPDPTFTAPASLPALTPLAVRPDGQLWVRAATSPTTATLHLLQANGALATSQPAVPITTAGLPTSSWQAALQPTDGKLLLYGNFSHVAAQPRFSLARLAGSSALAVRPGAGTAAGLRVYPTPTAGPARLALPAPLSQPGTLDILDSQGRRVRQLPVPAATPELPLDPAGLAPGLYLLRCGTLAGRLLVE